MDFDNSVDTNRYILYSVINRYKDHPSNLKIKYELSSKSRFDNDLSPYIFVTLDEVEKLLNSNKAAGRDKLPIKLNKIVSEILSKPLL